MFTEKFKQSDLCELNQKIPLFWFKKNIMDV